MHYRCQNCGGNVVYDPEKKKMVCESCRSEESQVMIPQKALHVCGSCGAVIDAGDHTFSTRCPYCQTYLIFEDRLQERKPDLVLPFELSRQTAGDLLKKAYQDQMFLPKNFCSASSIEAMEGIYVPFFMVDFKSRTRFEGEGDVVRVWTSGNYEYTETSIFKVRREFEVDYSKMPVDAASSMDDHQMDLMEPYNYEELKEFDTEYLSGFFADTYDEDEEAILPRAREKAEKYSGEYLHSMTTEYQVLRPFTDQTDHRVDGIHYAFLPVWKYVYRFRDHNYEFFVNGQTGKVTGEPPVDWIRGLVGTGVLGVSVFLLLQFFFYFLGVL